ncbi:Ferritin, partial [Caligus rogercresseyi]
LIITMTSQIRQNYDSECEALINKQINMEFFASYTYLSMGAYFARDDVALEGFAKFFYDSSAEENTHARKLIDYQNLRGGRVVFQDISRPSVDSWDSAVEAMKAALQLEKDVNESLLGIHALPPRRTIHSYATSWMDGIKKIGTLLTRMKSVGPGVGMHLLDQELLRPNMG